MRNHHDAIFRNMYVCFQRIDAVRDCAFECHHCVFWEGDLGASVRDCLGEFALLCACEVGWRKSVSPVMLFWDGLFGMDD